MKPPTIDGMDFDRYTVVLLVTPDNPPQLSEEAELAGVLDLVAMPWMLPAGAIHFTPTTFPRSTRDV